MDIQPVQPSNPDPAPKAPPSVISPSNNDKIATPTPQQTQAQPYSASAYSYSDLSKKSGSKRVKKLLLGLMAVLVVVLIVGLIYFWILPTRQASAYTTSIKDPYNQQIAKMQDVYQSFKKPVFTTDNTQPANDAKDFAFTQSVIKAGQEATKNLENKNKLQLSPGSNLLSQASKAQKQYDSVKAYIAQSNKFLSDYQTTVTYMDKFEQLSIAQEPQILNSINALGTAKTLPQYSALVQNADTVLSKFTSDLRALNPSSDLMKFNDDAVGDFIELQQGLDTISQAIKSTNATLLVQGAQQVQDAGAKLTALGNQSVSDNLQNHSSLHTQITNLETIKPL